MNRLRPAVAAGCAGLVAAVLLVLPAAAQAHARLVRAVPEKGAVLKRQPRAVVFTFNEPIEAEFGAVRVFNAEGMEVQRGAPFRPAGQGKALAVALQPNLAEGTYRATFRILSADSHPVTGGTVFSVGKPTPGGVKALVKLPDQGGTGTVVQVAFWADRWLGYAAIGIAVGALFFLVWAWRPALAAGRGDDGLPGAVAVFDRRFRRLLWAAIVTGAVVSLLAIPLEGADAAGSSLRRALHRSVIDEVVRTRFGSLMLLRTGAWILLGGILLVAAARNRARAREPGAEVATETSLELIALVMLPIGSLLVSPALAGHARTESPVAVLFPSDVVHVTSMALWLGGLVALVVAVPAALRELEPLAGDRLRLDAVSRFSRIALVSVIALAASGTVQAVIDVGSISALYDTGYGLMVVAKVLLLLTLIGLGAANRRRLLPALARAAEAAKSAGRLAASLRQNLRIEVALLAVVLGITAVLVTYLPPGGSGGIVVPAAGPKGRQIGQTTLGPATLKYTVDPARVGLNTVNIYLLDAAGRRPYTAAQNVRTEIAPESGGPPVTAPLVLVGPGHYVNSAAQFTDAGLWSVKVLATLPGAPAAEAELFVPVS